MFTLNCKGRLLIVDKPQVMGIINTTPDSFYGSSRFTAIADILKQAEKMLQEGASILDVGGQSTRPGSARIDEEEELKRVIAPVSEIAKHFPAAFISTDSYYARVVKEAVAAGASIVNDIGAGLMDNDMLNTVASLGTPYICMHMQGRPETMQQQPVYENITRELIDFFIERTAACKKAGINDVIIDPGFGFGKTSAHNFQLLRELDAFSILGHPLLAAVSRKGIVYKTLGITAAEALNGTTVLNTIALIKGASFLRVHDVREACEAVKLVDQLTIYP
jgi:dihydropteroate synthase